MSLKQTTSYLTPDAIRAIKMHMASNPMIETKSQAIDDMLVRFERLTSVSGSQADVGSFEELLTYLKEQNSGIEQLTILTLRNYGLNVEIAKRTDPDVLQKGEARARALLKQLKES